MLRPYDAHEAHEGETESMPAEVAINDE